MKIRMEGGYLQNKIICADARDLDSYVEPGSVTLTVTSPPYRNAINYSTHVENIKNSGNTWVRGTGVETTEAYIDTMQQIFDQVFKATRDGGFCCVVIGDEVVDAKLIPLPSLILQRLVNTENEDDPDRWRFRDMIIWHKVTSGRNGAGNRFGMFAKYQYPGYFRANIMHEYILVLQKGRRLEDDPRRGKSIPFNRIVKREIANSIWNIPPVPPGMVEHPVPFPEQIPWRLATLLTRPDDMILDPMNGSGQTTKVARSLGRRYLGFDLRQEYVDEARRRLEEPPRLSNYLIPIYHKESWSRETQGGFFETTEVDLSPNIPKGYRLAFWGKNGLDQGAAYIYYKNPESEYACFIIGKTGRHYRLILGGLKTEGSILHDALMNLPEGIFGGSQVGSTVKTSILSSRYVSKACLDMLLHLDCIDEDEDGSYRLTQKGESLRRRWIDAGHDSVGLAL